MRGLTISRAARQAGVNLETIRFYERKGLIRRPATPAHGCRNYDDDTIQAIRFIKRAQELGFSLMEIKELLSLRRGDGTCAAARIAAERKLKTVREKLEDLSAVKRALEGFIARCLALRPDDVCPLLATLDFARGDSEASPPSIDND